MTRELGGAASGAGVRTALRLLEEHGLLVHSIEERDFIYRAAGPRRQIAIRAAGPLAVSPQAAVSAP